MITTKKIDPRPYQQKAAAAIHREWDAGNKKTLVVMPTGTGKTIVFASIVNDQVAKGEHVLILAHREELLQQASDKLKMVTGLETALEKAQSSALDSDKMVVVASVQTLSKQNRLMKYPRDYFGTIIIDEAHHTAAKTYKAIPKPGSITGEKVESVSVQQLAGAHGCDRDQPYPGARAKTAEHNREVNCSEHPGFHR